MNVMMRKVGCFGMLIDLFGMIVRVESLVPLISGFGGSERRGLCRSGLKRGPFYGPRAM